MADQEQPWYAAYPPANSTPENITCTALLQLLKQSRDDEKFVLIDLRRTDHEVCRLWIDNPFPNTLVICTNPNPHCRAGP